MPTYDYECDACGHAFELFQSIRDEPEKKCPRCGKRKLRRLIGSGGAILFKGSGFYTTDYRSRDYHKQAKSESKSSESNSPGDTSDSGKSDKGSKSSDTKSGSDS